MWYHWIMQDIEIINARKHNLKGISLKIPKRKLVAITGVSGSGKSTLAYDTIFQEGQRKYLESLSIYARQFIKSLEKPEVQTIRGISPTISIDQKHSSFYYNSTVGTISEVSQYLRLLYARSGEARCPGCGKIIRHYSARGVSDYIYSSFSNKLVKVFAPVVKNRKGNYKALFEKYIKRGFLKAWIDGELHYLDDVPELNRQVPHNIDIQVDALKVKQENRKRLEESLALASFESGGELIVMQDRQRFFFSNKLFCTDCNISIKEPQPAAFSLNSPIAVCPLCKGKGTVSGTDGEACESCGGSGFNSWALSFYFKDKNIFQLGEMEIHDLLAFFKGIVLKGDEATILAPIMPQILQRLESFIKLKLGYITLNRKINTLSGGELQRTRLVSQIGFSLSGIIYILDEPSIGMHLTEQKHLVEILKELKKKDNTIIVVEHDEHTINSSDYIVDLGPGAGEQGGFICYCGRFKDFKEAQDCLTADYIFKRKTLAVKKPYVLNLREQPFIEVSDITVHNIAGACLKIPLQALTVVTGVSGSGKSSLIIDAFYPIVKQTLDKRELTGKRVNFKKLEGLGDTGRIMMVTQTAIGKNARSCPATYINIMPFIRELFAGLTESRIRGYGPARFSFNVSGGRCEACKGLGYKKLEMSFLPELEVPCPVCEGRRYNSETLRMKYNGLSIADVLELTAADAYSLFKNIPQLAKKIKILLEVGLGYLKLGQPSGTLSGGESQRIKLTKELSRISSKPTIYLLDEPTIGLHFDDIRKLLDVLHGLIVRGNTVVVVEHNMEVVKAADYIVDLGPGGGKNGGKILYQGEPGGLKTIKNSATGLCLR
jgi:excinuclease ABC subunit A